MNRATKTIASAQKSFLEHNGFLKGFNRKNYYNKMQNIHFLHIYIYFRGFEAISLQ